MTDEIAQLRRKVAELETSGLHTCHDECPRLACVQGREIRRLRAALVRIRDCDWVITLPDRMDAVRDIAREALEGLEP
jgi:hypothetical protein